MRPFGDAITQKHGYSSKHRESENKVIGFRYSNVAQWPQVNVACCWCFLWKCSSSPGIITHFIPGYLQSEINADPSRRRIAFYISDTDDIPHAWHTKMTTKGDQNNNKRKSNVDRVVHGDRISNGSFTSAVCQIQHIYPLTKMVVTVYWIAKSMPKYI